MTASTPVSVRVPSGTYMVGMPPPPAQMTIVPFSSSHLIGRISKIRLGSGEGTTRRHFVAVRLERPALLGRQAFGRPPCSYTGPTNLVGSAKAGSSGSTSTMRQDGGEGDLEGQQVAELLLDHVADHALGLRAEHVERVGFDVLVGLKPASASRPTCGPLPCASTSSCFSATGARRGGDADVLTLHFGRHRFPAA